MGALALLVVDGSEASHGMSTRRALVTGGSRGIGAAIAEALAKDGYRVAVHYRTEVAAANAVVAALPGAGHAVVSADLADPAAVASMVDAAASALGGIDVLVNNAAIYDEHPIDQTTYAEWQAAWGRMVQFSSANLPWQVRSPAAGRLP